MRYTYNEALARYVGERIISCRKEAGLSQRAVSSECYLSDGTISRWESGDHSPSLESLLRAALAIGVEPSELLPTLKELPGIL